MKSGGAADRYLYLPYSFHVRSHAYQDCGGIGEVGTPAATAAAANAWARATGKQPRNFPLNDHGA